MSSTTLLHRARPATDEVHEPGTREPVPSSRTTSRSTRIIALLLAFVVLAGFSACDEPGGTKRRTGSGATGTGIWMSRQELAKLPISGPAWDGVMSAADGAGPGNIADQDSDDDVNTLAAGARLRPHR